MMYLYLYPQPLGLEKELQSPRKQFFVEVIIGTFLFGKRLYRLISKNNHIHIMSNQYIHFFNDVLNISMTDYT